MLEQLNEVSEELGELKLELENKQEILFWEKVDADSEYKKELSSLDKDQEDEINWFLIEFTDILAGMKESIFLDANKHNEELVISDTRSALVWLEKEIANS